MDSKLRTVVLVGALIATGGAVYWANQLPGGDEDLATPSAPRVGTPVPRGAPPADASKPAGNGALDLARLNRPPIDGPAVSLFESRSFAPEPPKPTAAELKRQREIAAKAPPPPPPPPPPLPFTYMGQLAEGKDVLVFLTEGDRNLSVKKGETIDDKYRVEDINQSELVLVYLPQNVKQTLPIGVAK